METRLGGRKAGLAWSGLSWTHCTADALRVLRPEAQEMTVRAPLRWPRQVWTIQPASV